jgi:hypothetical protein
MLHCVQHDKKEKVLLLIAEGLFVGILYSKVSPTGGDLEGAESLLYQIHQLQHIFCPVFTQPGIAGLDTANGGKFASVRTFRFYYFNFFSSVVMFNV